MMIKTEDYNGDDEISSEIIITMPNDYAGMRLDAAMAALLPDFSRSQLARQIKEGALKLNEQIETSGKTKIIGGEKIIFRLPESVEVMESAAENIPLDVVYEDEQVLVINKQAGLVVHPAAGNHSGTLLNGLLHYCPDLRNIPRAGIVHRLDKDTTGLMVVAKTLQAQTHLVRQLQERSVKRIYRAIANGIVPYDGKIETLIGRNPHNRLKMAVVSFGGKEAVTHVTVLERFETHTYIECALETGRTHQIRVHMRQAGHPLAGDPLYGNPRFACAAYVKEAILHLNRQALHAQQLSFRHPESGELIQFNSPLPDDMKMLLSALRDMPFPQDEDSNHDDWEDDDDENGVEIIYAPN